MNATSGPVGNLESFRATLDVNAVRTLARAARALAAGRALSAKELPEVDAALLRLQLDANRLPQLAALLPRVLEHESDQARAEAANAELSRARVAADAARSAIAKREAAHQKATAPLRRQLEEADERLARETADDRAAVAAVERLERVRRQAIQDCESSKGAAASARREFVELAAPRLAKSREAVIMSLRSQLAAIDSLDQRGSARQLRERIASGEERLTSPELRRRLAPATAEELPELLAEQQAALARLEAAIDADGRDELARQLRTVEEEFADAI